MGFAIDLILAVLLAACLITGYQKGLIDSVIRLFGFLCAVVFGYRLSEPLGRYYYETFFREKIADSYESKLSELTSDIQNDWQSLIEEVPKALSDIFERLGITSEQLQQTYQDNAAYGEEQLRHSLAEYAARPMAEMISDVLAFLTVFVAVLLIVEIVKLILGLIFKLPILRTLNKSLGLLLGGVVGLLYTQVLSFLLWKALPFLYTQNPTVFPLNLPSKTVIFRYLCEYNLFYTIFS